MKQEQGRIGLRRVAGEVLFLRFIGGAAGRAVRAARAVAALLATAAPHADAASWTHPHADAANTGFVDVLTAPASLPSAHVDGIGEVAPGAGPVVGPDGTVYVGNLQGQLRALRPDGTLKWMRDTPGQRIVAPPAIGADGAIYVVGTAMARDHRSGGEPRLWHAATLYRFNSGGGMEWARPFPSGPVGSDGAGAAYAAPNIWRSGGAEVIIVPVLHVRFGYARHLVAFTAGGALVADHKVSEWSFGDVTGGASFVDTFCAIVPLCFNRLYGLEETVPEPGPDELPLEVRSPAPAVGIFAQGGGTPVVVVADGHERLVGYSYAPAQGFQEIFRKHLVRGQIGMSVPTLLPDGHSVIRGSSDDRAWVLFGGPATVNWTEVPIGLSHAAPTLTAEGTILMVERAGAVTAVGTTPTRAVRHRVTLPGESIAAASASCSHVYVSTAGALVTLDAKATGMVARFDWRGGGLTAPAIGPDGRVYAIAGETLFVFPPPQTRPSRFGGAGGRIFSCRAPVVGPGRDGGGPVLQ